MWKFIKQYQLDDVCQVHGCKLATDDDLAVVHDKYYIQYIKAYLDNKSLPMAKDDREKDIVRKAFGDSLYHNEHTLTAALLAAGAACDLCDAVCEGKLKNGFAMVRPPGHHAGGDYARGFCYFNNVAIVAGRAIAKHNLKRVFILDFDVHHGKYVVTVARGMLKLLLMQY